MSSTLGIIFTNRGIIVANGASAAAALADRVAGSLASGEAVGVIINKADNAAPVVEAMADSKTIVDLSQDAIASDVNGMVRDTVGAVLGILAGYGASPLGPAASLAADQIFSEAYSKAHNAASQWSSQQDFSPFWDQFFDAIHSANYWSTGALNAAGNAFLNLFLPEGLRPIDIGTSTFFSAANRYVPRHDPLI